MKAGMSSRFSGWVLLPHGKPPDDGQQRFRTSFSSVSYQAMASIPRIEASVSSFAAGPLGLFSPRSHLLTMPTVTFKWAAKTA